MFIEMQIRIPDELRCVIFDASSVTRGLIQYDKSIRHLDVDVARDYSACQIDCVNIGSSKYHLDNKDNLEFQVELLKEWMAELEITGPELLVVTQKCRSAKGSRGDEYSVDIKARLEQEIPGVRVITWGSERGVNEYKGIKYTANIGMKWRKRDDLQADIQAQKRDLSDRVDYQEIDNVQQSEFLSEVQQWIPRTNMRVSIDGKALETRILFMHSEATPLAERLSRGVFPGINVNLYRHNIETEAQKREVLVSKVVGYLESLAKEKISTAQLKRDLGLRELSKDRWENISKRSEESLSFQWEKYDRSWVNTGASLHG